MPNKKLKKSKVAGVNLPAKDAKQVTQPGKEGKQVTQPAKEGKQVTQPAKEGKQVTQPAKEGKQITQPAKEGKQITQPAKDGKQITQPAKEGKQVTQPAKEGKQVTQPAKDGKQVTQPAKDGKQVTQPAKEGKQITQPAKEGKQITQPAKGGKQITQPAKDANWVTQAGKDAKQISPRKDKEEIFQDVNTKEMQSFSSEKCTKKALLSVFLLEKGTIALKAVFNTFYCHKDAKTKNGELPFHEWQEELGISNKEIKKIFGGYKPAKGNSPVLENYDLVTYHKLITAMNTEFYKEKICFDCKEKIDKICRYKNLVCHFGPLSEKDYNLENWCHLLHELLNCVLKHLESKKYIAEALKELSKPVNVDKDPHELQQKYESCLYDLIRTSPHLFFMRSGQCELKRKEVSQRFTIPFYWIYSVSDEQSFCQRSSQLFEPAPMNIFTNPYLRYCENRLDCADLLKPDMDSADVPPEVIIIVGHGGCGKTTLCSHIFLEWQKKIEKDDVMYKGLDSIDLVFLIEMRSTNCKSLAEFLGEFIPETYSTEKKSDLNNYFENLEVLYIIDGFDERNEKNTKLVQDIAKLKRPSTRIILTTRPECLKDAQKIFSNIPANLTAVVDIVGFNREGRNDFSCRILSEDHFKSVYKSVKPEEFCAFLKKQEEELDEYLNLPLTVALILLLWLETNDLEIICTATQLYTELFEMLTSKLIMARKHSSVGECIIDNHSVKAVLDVLSRCANSAVFSTDFRIDLAASSLKEIGECCEEYGVCLKEFLSAFLQFDRLSTESKEINYSFFHRTEMEFLSAQCLAKSSMSSLEQEEDYEKLQMCFGILKFLVGHLGSAKKLDKFSPIIIQLLQRMQISSVHYNFYSRLIVESTTSNKHGDQCRKPFCSQLCDLMSHKKWCLNAETVLSGLRLLGHCAYLDLEELDIDLQMSCNPDEDESLSYLESNLGKLQRIFQTHHKRKIDVYFHIQNHYEKQGSGVSDVYLSRLLGWANLVKFTGAIGAEGVKHLPNFVHIKHLDLRMSKPEIFNDFVKHCLGRCRKLKQLQLVMDFPSDMEPSLLTPLNCGCINVLRLRFDGTDRKNLRWALDVINAVWHDSLGGFDRITFQGTNFNRKRDADIIVKALCEKVFTKVIVSSYSNSTHGPPIIKRPDCPFVFEWEDH